jgi:hypothetical protein
VSPIWPIRGTFELVEQTPGSFLIIRNDGVAMEVLSISESRLTVGFRYTPPGSGRVKDVGGEYEFEFTR